MDDKLRRLQLCELEILDEFVRVCEKYGFQYYLVGGTLLGAVRHKGFIPWDDDVDVAMPREDYDRFAEIAQQELGPQYFYQSPDTDPYYFLTYNKIRKNGTKVYEERFKNAKFHKGVFIDIFPLDFCPKPGLVCHLLFNVLAVMNYRGQVDSGEECHTYNEISGKVGYTVLRIFMPRELVMVRKMILRLSKRISGKQYVASYSGAYGYKSEVFKTGWFFGDAQVGFEDRVYKAPHEYILLLKKLFGENYMDLPSPYKRVFHVNLSQTEF